MKASHHLRLVLNPSSAKLLVRVAHPLQPEAAAPSRSAASSDHETSAAPAPAAFTAQEARKDQHQKVRMCTPEEYSLEMSPHSTPKLQHLNQHHHSLMHKALVFSWCNLFSSFPFTDTDANAIPV
eukprot:1151980-Pelagomonas_calceolata.AAC.3